MFKKEFYNFRQADSRKNQQWLMFWHLGEMARQAPLLVRGAGPNFVIGANITKFYFPSHGLMNNSQNNYYESYSIQVNLQPIKSQVERTDGDAEIMERKLCKTDVQSKENIFCRGHSTSDLRSEVSCYFRSVVRIFCFNFWICLLPVVNLFLRIITAKRNGKPTPSQLLCRTAR